MGSKYILELDEPAEVKQRCTDALSAHFRPEFLNRIDSIVIFDRLKRDRIRQIVDVHVERLAPMLRERQLTLVLSDAAKDRLAELGYDPAYGARPLKRALREHILEPLSEALLTGRFASGDVVCVDATDGRLVLRPGEPALAAR